MKKYKKIKDISLCELLLIASKRNNDTIKIAKYISKLINKDGYKY